MAIWADRLRRAMPFPILAQRSDVELRRFVFASVAAFHDVYWFEHLDDVVGHLAATLDAGVPGALPDSLSEDIDGAEAENSVSLNRIAAVLRRLADRQTLTPDEVYGLLDKVFEARACNEDPASFLDREIELLSVRLDEVRSKRP